jgi:peptide/nickel transport system substrate-binding protein
MKRCALISLAAVIGLALAAMPAAVLGADTLVVLQEAEPVGLDLMQSSIQTTMSACYNLHDTLFHPQEDASVKPALAEKWEKVDDLTWKITLHKDAVFHNGEPVNAAAVKFSYERINKAELQSPNKGKLSAFTALEVVDEHTFTIKTDQPYAPGLYMLGYYLPIVPPKYTQEVGDAKYNTDPVGSGPYKLAKWVRGEEIVFERFDKYYGPKPAYKTVIFKANPEEASRMAALVTGEAQVVSGIPVHQRKKVLESGKAYLTDQMGTMPYLGINTYEAPFDDVRVRQALNHAIDKALISKALFDGKAIVCNGPISPRTFGASPALKPYAFDPDKAKALLKEAGHADGLDVRLAYPTYMSQIQEQAEAIAATMGKAGFRVTLEPFERAVMWERYKGKQHQLYIYFWDDAPEPDRYVYPLFHSKSRDYYYKNPAVDELLDKGRTVMDPAARAKVYAQIDEMLYKDAPWAYLYVVPEVFAVANDVDYQGRRDGFLNMRYAKPKK